MYHFLTNYLSDTTARGNSSFGDAELHKEQLGYFARGFMISSKWSLTIIMVSSAFLGSISESRAGGEDTFALGIGPSACARAGYFGTPVRKGTKCTLSVYNTYGRINYWIQFQKIGKLGWKNLTTKRTWRDGNGDGHEDLVITVGEGRYYRLVGDFNGDNYPDTYNDAEAIFSR